MVIEHTFVTTLEPAEAGVLASGLLKHAGFVDREAIPQQAGEQRDQFEMIRESAGQFGSIDTVPCPQTVTLDYDRGRIIIAATITPILGGRFSWSPAGEPSPSSPAAQPYANLMIALAEALEQSLVNRQSVEAALERWKVLDGLIPRLEQRSPVRRTVMYACAAVALLSIIGGAIKRSGNLLPISNPRTPTLSFPANEDARDEVVADRDTFADARLEELRVEADAVLRNTNAPAGREVGAVFALGDRLGRAGRWPRAFQYYEAGLKRVPGDYVHRLAYADILNRQNERPAAVAHARIVLTDCEDVNLAAKAQALIGSAGVEITPLTPLTSGKPILVLVPMGDADLMLLQSEQKKLHDDLGIEVQLHSTLLNFGVMTRNPLQLSADLIRGELAKVRKEKPREYDAMLRYVGLTQNDLADNAKAVSLGAYLLRRIRQGETASNLESLSDHADLQWSAEGMTEGFAAAVHPFSMKNVRFLGITRSDLMADNGDPLFGYWQGDGGVISYRRFMARFNKEVQNRSRLSRRLHLQALASAGQIFGLPNCTDRACARSYPSSLADQDAKSDKICDICRKGFAEAFAKCSKD